MNGKGSDRRPAQVSDYEMERRWDATFPRQVTPIVWPRCPHCGSEMEMGNTVDRLFHPSDTRELCRKIREDNAEYDAKFGSSRVGDSRVAWWTLFIGACLALAVILSSCANSTQQAHRAPRIGACERPPMVHQGYDLAGCGVNARDESQVWCLYVAVINGQRCRALVQTRGCGPWVLDEENTGCDTGARWRV